MQSDEAISTEAIMMDGLREIGSIGAAHASTALSNLVGKDILVEVSECFVCTTQELPAAFDNIEQTVVAVFLEAYGKGKGGIMLVLSQQMAIELSDMILSRPREGERELDETDKDAVCEIGNICASAYLSAVAKFTGVTMMPSPPGVAVDMLHAILQFPAALVEAESSESVVIRTQFLYGDAVCFGFMLYIPDKDTMSVLSDKFRMV